VARTTVPRAVTMSCMATAHNPERHGREAGSSQEQEECVQIHVSIETVCWAVRPSLTLNSVRRIVLPLHLKVSTALPRQLRAPADSPIEVE
jgi:hypothetical protein